MMKRAKPKRPYRRRERPSAIVEVEVESVTHDGFLVEPRSKGKRQRILLPMPEEEPRLPQPVRMR